MKRLGVLVSGGGTNMQSIIDAIEAKIIDAQVVVVISSNSEAHALERAKKNGIPNLVLSKAQFVNSVERDKKLKEVLISYNVDYVILAGYLGIVSSDLIEEYPYKIINIHPALLPKYGGHNYYGINVHRAVIEAKEPYSGATVHFVDEGTDTGLIIRQQKLEVMPNDTPESLQQRILNNIEHVLFVEVIRDICDGTISVKNGKLLDKSL